ncbi:hypothetical protein TCAL_16554 [Tigriopus californicus]|uniref:Dolichol phosphate-mannose biosynthesis regulatory protein n=1 Tax=Tigriopus californicus TaxID=6832 RepID=A0A553NBJ7_TIGCA|nr:hypothetical protein TCAL_16554 [Tigriopus californicus]
MWWPEHWRGQCQLGVVALVLVYYTLCVIGLPFVEPAYRPWIEPWFPSPSTALAWPALIGTVVAVTLWGRAYQLVRQDRRATDCGR